MKPSIGRIVHYAPMRGEWPHDGEPLCVAGLIVAITGDCPADDDGTTCVALTAFMPDGTTKFVKHAPPHTAVERGTWHWPERTDG
ncbi:hypothetical protein [Streptomyces mirabilis]|uniref:hypothetical protein n=1 Tax=Streptomyces mirabilis TaxID=68239 RepID=UPI0033EB501A